MSITQFRDEIQNLEVKMSDKLDQKFKDLNQKQIYLREDQAAQKQHFDELNTKVRSECLWRIKDAEELIKSRVSNVVVDTHVKALRHNFERDVHELQE